MALLNDINAAISRLKTKSPDFLLTNSDALEILQLVKQVYDNATSSQISISAGAPVGFTPDCGIRVTQNGIIYVTEGQTLG